MKKNFIKEEKKGIKDYKKALKRAKGMQRGVYKKIISDESKHVSLLKTMASKKKVNVGKILDKLYKRSHKELTKARKEKDTDEVREERSELKDYKKLKRAI